MNRLVGRDSVVSDLRERLDRSARGQGAVALILGEPGIGKSRLLRELAAVARSAGMTVLTGVCYEDTAAVPFAWLADLLDRATIDLELATMVDDALKHEPLSVLRGVLNADASAPQPPPQLAARLVRRLTAHRPALLVIEDVHWSDEAGISALLTVIRRAPEMSVLVAVSAREGGDQRVDALAEEITRQRSGAIHTLGPLDEEAVAAMAGSFLGTPVQDRPSIRSLWKRTDGNPFFVEEMLASLKDRGLELTTASLVGMPVPRTVHIAVRRRMRRLSSQARRIAEAASIEGRRFLITDVAATVEADQLNALNAATELSQAGFIDDIGRGRFAFRHALTQEAIQEIVLGWERRQLHARIADRLEGRPDSGAGHLAELSWHRFEAADWKLALSAALKAAELDLALGAPSTALREIHRAERAATELGTPLSDHALRLRSRARDLRGEFEAAVADIEQVRLRAVQAGDRPGQWQATLELGALWGARDYQRAGEYFDAALEIVSTLEDSAALAETLNRRGNWLLVSERPIEALAAHDRSRQLFESAADADGVARTRDLTGTVLLTLGRHLEAGEAYREAAAYFRSVNDSSALVSALTMFSFCGIQYLSGAGTALGASLTERWRALEEALALSVNIEWRSGEALARIAMANVLGAKGRLGDALNEVERGLGLAREIEHRYWMIAGNIVKGALLAEVWRLDAASRSFDEAIRSAEEVRSDYWRRIATGLAVPIHLSRRQPAAARAALAVGAVRDDGVREETAVTSGERWLLLARAEVALSEGHAEEALRVTTSIDVALRALGGPPGLAVVDLQARALVERARYDEAISSWRGALTLAEEDGATSFSAGIHARLARVLRQLRRRGEAEASVGEGRRLVHELASSLPEPSRADYLQACAAAFPELTERQRRKAAHAGLTDREVAVARLVAEGLTNAAIAETLVLSPRTVEKHLERILTKLDLAGRSQVAVWAVRSGLIGSAKDT